MDNISYYGATEHSSKPDGSSGDSGHRLSQHTTLSLVLFTGTDNAVVVVVVTVWFFLLGNFFPRRHVVSGHLCRRRPFPGVRDTRTLTHTRDAHEAKGKKCVPWVFRYYYETVSTPLCCVSTLLLSPVSRFCQDPIRLVQATTKN